MGFHDEELAITHRGGTEMNLLRDIDCIIRPSRSIALNAPSGLKSINPGLSLP